MWKKITTLILILILSGCGLTQNANSSHSGATGSDPQEESQKQHDETMDALSQTTKETSNANLEVTSTGISVQDKQNGITPATIKIDSIGVKSSVEKVGMMENGQMAVPENFRITGWYQLGPKPGERGSAVIAGHVDDKTGPGVFFNLIDLEKGDKVEVMNNDGEKLVFEVVGKKIFPMDDAPVKQIFGYTSRRMLNLVTCTGPFDRSKGGHIDRLVVYTELIES